MGWKFLKLRHLKSIVTGFQYLKTGHKHSQIRTMYTVKSDNAQTHNQCDSLTWPMILPLVTEIVQVENGSDAVNVPSFLMSWKQGKIMCKEAIVPEAN